MNNTYKRKDFKKSAPTKKGDFNVSLPDSSYEHKLLTSHGVARQVMTFPSFSLENHVANFVSEVDGLKPKSVPKQKQLDAVKKVYENPFKAPYVFCISGNPNDMRAKMLAVMILSRAIHLFRSQKDLDEKTVRKLKHKSSPVFHNVMGWSKNPLLESSNSPSLLVLSNVPKGMTQYKQEKLRDILEKYSDVPRIVVTTGHDPVTFFNGSLYMSVNYVCYLTDKIVKKSHEI